MGNKKREVWLFYQPWILFYSRPPNAPNMANNAKNNATGRIPITVHAVSFAFAHSVAPCPVGQLIASDTSEKISIPINNATAAPINARIKPNDKTMRFHHRVIVPYKKLDCGLI